MTDARHIEVRFSLAGGPLHRLGRRLGLVHGDADCVRLGLVLGTLPWMVLVALALLGGDGSRLASARASAAHVQLLVAVPLFFVCESLFDPYATAFLRTIARGGIVPPGELPALAAWIERSDRWRDAWAPELACSCVAVLASLLWPHAQAFGVAGATPPFSPSVVWWYWTVCVPLFRFLLLRWLWRLGMWWRALWRLSRMDLHLLPGHPDRAAGIGGV